MQFIQLEKENHVIHRQPLELKSFGLYIGDSAGTTTYRNKNVCPPNLYILKFSRAATISIRAQCDVVMLLYGGLFGKFGIIGREIKNQKCKLIMANI